MSNRPHPHTTRTASALQAMTGHRLPGGCDDCDAYQVLTRCTDGLYVLTVHHDDTCPLLMGVLDTNRKEHQ